MLQTFPSTSHDKISVMLIMSYSTTKIFESKHVASNVAWVQRSCTSTCRPTLDGPGQYFNCSPPPLFRYDESKSNTLRLGNLVHMRKSFTVSNETVFVFSSSSSVSNCNLSTRSCCFCRHSCLQEIVHNVMFLF